MPPPNMVLVSFSDKVTLGSHEPPLNETPSLQGSDLPFLHGSTPRQLC